MTSQETKNIIAALIKAQKKIKHAQKDAKNPHFKNQYATLESVIDASKDALLENDVVVSQVYTRENLLITRLMHSSGEWIESVIALVLNKNDMQQLGSATTYGRRYALAAILNIAQTDDDGNLASQPQNNQATAQSATNTLSESIDLGSYIIQMGDKNKMTGTKLSDHTDVWLRKSADSTIDYYKKQNKPMHKNAKEFVDVVEAYLKQKADVGF